MSDPKKGFLLRIPQPLFDELRRWAEQDMRSINGQIEWVLRDALKKRGRPQAEPDDDSTDRDSPGRDSPGRNAPRNDSPDDDQRATN